MKRNSRLYIFLIIKIIYVSYDILGKYQKTWKRKLNSFIIPPAKGNDIIISPFALSVLTPTHRHKLYFQNTAYIILYIQDSVFLLFNQLYFLYLTKLSLYGERNGNPLQYFCLENSMDRGAWLTTDYGVTKSQTQLSVHTQTHTHTGTQRLKMLSTFWCIYWPFIYTL